MVSDVRESMPATGLGQVDPKSVPRPIYSEASWAFGGATTASGVRSLNCASRRAASTSIAGAPA
eukprot:10746701-Alexandrium_andersonii.AAC.1